MALRYSIESLWLRSLPRVNIDTTAEAYNSILCIRQGRVRIAPRLGVKNWPEMAYRPYAVGARLEACADGVWAIGHFGPVLDTKPWRYSHAALPYAQDRIIGLSCRVYVHTWQTTQPKAFDRVTEGQKGCPSLTQWFKLLSHSRSLVDSPSLSRSSSRSTRAPLRFSRTPQVVHR